MTASTTNLAFNMQFGNGSSAAANYDDTDPAWTYAGGSWLTYSATGPYGGGEHYINTLNSTASITINGGAFTFLYSSDTNRSTAIQVIIDSVVVATISQNGPHAFQQIYTSPLLTVGSHTVQFKNVGSGYMTVDALLVFTMYDDTDGGWTYAAGSWLTYSATGPFGGSEHYLNTLNCTATFSFTGTKFILYYSSDTNRANVQVTVDSVVVDTFTENAAHAFQATYKSAAFSAGAPTL